MSVYSADIYEDAIVAAIAHEDLRAAVSLMRRMAVEHPDRADRLLNTVQSALDALMDRGAVGEWT